jgi:hypothetical protein
VNIYTTKCDIYALDIDVRNHLKKTILYDRFFPLEKRKEKETILFKCISVGKHAQNGQFFLNLFQTFC